MVEVLILKTYLYGTSSYADSETSARFFSKTRWSHYTWNYNKASTYENSKVVTQPPACFPHNRKFGGQQLITFLYFWAMLACVLHREPFIEKVVLANYSSQVIETVGVHPPTPPWRPHQKTPLHTHKILKRCNNFFLSHMRNYSEFMATFANKTVSLSKIVSLSEICSLYVQDIMFKTVHSQVSCFGGENESDTGDYWRLVVLLDM